MFGTVARRMVAGLADACGVALAAKTFLRAPALLVLTYHRIGQPADCESGSGTYSADAESFRQQLEWLRCCYPVLTLDEALSALKRPNGLARPSVLITFDDGYRDNYSVALPLLRDAGLPATFFLPTALVGTNLVPWRDQVAYAIRNARRTRFALNGVEYDLNAMPADRVIANLLRRFREDGPARPSAFVAEVAGACDGPIRRCSPERHLISWDDARAMLACGMAIGSHTHTHALLGRLTPEDQTQEAVQSRDVLKHQLGIAPRAIALPCGSRSLETPSILARAGYEAAFCTTHGVNLPEIWNFYQLRRVPVDRNETPAGFRMRIALTLGLRRHGT